MIGCRTKQVFAYGKRSQRVVNVYDESKAKVADSDTRVPDVRVDRWDFDDILATTKHAPPPKTSPPRNIKPKRISPKVAKVGGVDVVKPARRLPLGSIPPNAPSSPAIPPLPRVKRRQTSTRHAPLVPASPVIDVDIVVLDSQGRRVSQEHRISKVNVKANVLPAAPLRQPSKLSNAASRPKSRTGARKTDPIVLSPDSEVVSPPRRKRKATTKAKPIVISDDESDPGSDYSPFKDSAKDADSSEDDGGTLAAPRLRRGLQRSRSNVILSPSPTPSLSPSPASTPIPTHPSTSSQHGSASIVPESPVLPSAPIRPAPPNPLTRHATVPAQLARPQTLGPFASLPDIDEPGPTRSKPRQLTPIRARLGRRAFPAPPSPPSPTTPSEVDLELSFDLEELTLSPHAFAEAERLEAAAAPAYMRPLLDECSQSGPHEFSAFIEMFPFDPIVRCEGPSGAGPARFQKIGEACYSEVFGIGDVVLKIIPLRDEARAGFVAANMADSPEVSDAKDVLKEIIVTRAMGATCAGFTELLRAYVVRGKYPSLLLDLWDEYEKRKGSESVRPDTFTVSQLYAIIVLPNGGPDLEAFAFGTPAKSGWQQACSIFWQVTRALAEAEELVSFEHRDLHWGQILVKNISAPAKGSARKAASSTPAPMDAPAHGVLVTIIDLGLARMDADARGAHWTPLDPEIFEGEGDYQFDVYRMMRAHVGEHWVEFRPLTNVMWLHYLVLKLLHAKRLRAPPATKVAERTCYECLKEAEGMLVRGLASVQAKRPRRRPRKTHAPGGGAGGGDGGAGPKSARELLAWAVSRGWVEP